MWGIAAAAALTYGLIRAALAEPARRRWMLERRLEHLRRVSPEGLSVDQAEDGAVIARRLGHKELEAYFKDRVSILKKQRRTQ